MLPFFNKRTSNYLVMTLLTRDNQDVLAKNIEFHLSQGVDFIIAMDHLSSDQTKDILLSYQKRGVLHYIEQKSTEFNQAKWVTQMAQMAKHRFSASWVINNDSDEFWWPTTKGKTLKQLFQDTPDSVNVLRCKRNNFIYPINADPKSFFLDTMIYKECQSSNSINEPLPPKVAHRGSRFIKVGAGNHAVSRLIKKQMQDAEIEIFHFPFRSREQLLQKVNANGQALKNGHIQDNTYTTWRKLYQQLESCESVDDFLTQYTYTEDQISDALKSKQLVKDTRLRDYLSKLKRKGLNYIS